MKYYRTLKVILIRVAGNTLWSDLIWCWSKPKWCYIYWC